MTSTRHAHSFSKAGRIARSRPESSVLVVVARRRTPGFTGACAATNAAAPRHDARKTKEVRNRLWDMAQSASMAGRDRPADRAVARFSHDTRGREGISAFSVRIWASRHPPPEPTHGHLPCRARHSADRVGPGRA